MAENNGLFLDFALLHFLLRDKKFALEMSKELTVEFFDPKLQVFYATLMKHFQDPSIREVLSLTALIDYCNESELKDQSARFTTIYNKARHLKSNGEEIPETDFRYFLKRLKHRRNIEIIREKQAEVQELMLANPSDPAELNEVLKTTIGEINNLNKIEVFDEGTVGSDSLNMFQEYQNIETDPTTFRGVTVGFPSLDNMTNGFQKGELSIICGMEGSGKSLLMMNWAINAWLGTNNPNTDEIAHNGHNILYYTLEMPRSNKGEFTQAAYLNKRIMCAVAELEFSEVRNGTLGDADKAYLEKTCKFMQEYERLHNRFYVVDIPRGARCEDIETKYLEVREKMNIDLVVIDYMGIMAADGDVPDHLAQGHIAEGLHEFARTYNIATLTAAQLNRPQGTKGQSLDKQSYNNTRLARSAMIGQNANNVFMIATRDEEELKDDMELYITKFRDGQKGKLVFTKRFNKMRVYDGSPLKPADPEVSLFEDIGNEEEEPKAQQI